MKSLLNQDNSPGGGQQIPHSIFLSFTFQSVKEIKYPFRKFELKKIIQILHDDQGVWNIMEEGSTRPALPYNLYMLCRQYTPFEKDFLRSFFNFLNVFFLSLPYQIKTIFM